MPGVFPAGDTRDEAIANAREAIGYTEFVSAARNR
ncbi:MAG: hypothetical protein J0M28_09085 [Thauera sp.]|nr:hypothetical protein [Thauera sp.]